MPIRWKLIFAIGCPLVLVMTVLLVLDYLRLRANAVQQNSVRLQEIAQRLAAQYEGMFNTIAQVARSSAAMVGAHPELNEQQLYDILRRNVEQDVLVYGSCAAFEAGVPRRRDANEPSAIPEAPRPRPRPNPAGFAPYVFRAQEGIRRIEIADVYDYTNGEWEWYDLPRKLGKEAWTDPYFDKDAGNVPMITFSMPLVREGAFIGVMTVDIQLEKLRRISMSKHPDETRVYILDRKGRFLLAPESDLIMSETVFQTAERLGIPEIADFSRRAMEGNQGVGAFVEPKTKKRQLLYFAPMTETGWSLGCISPENYFLGEQMAALRTRVAIGASLVAVILVMVSFIGSWIVRPVGRLAAAVQDLGAGNLSAAVMTTGGKDEIGRLARSFNTMTEELRRHVEALTRETAARQAVESELSIARAIQSSLLPRHFPERPEFELHAVSAPARQVGGDFFDFFFLDDHVLALVIADVSGKGVPAAIFMAVARTVVRDLATTGKLSPSEVMIRANTILLRENAEGMFVTMLFGQYDSRTGTLRYACAGHPPVYLVTAQGRVRTCTESTGTVLGVLGTETFTERSVMIVPGDRLVFYTDGVPEARSRSGEFFRESRFEELLASRSNRNARDLCEESLAEVQRFQDGDPHDDITLMVLGRMR